MNQTLPSDHPALVGMVNPFTRRHMKPMVSIVAAPGRKPYSRFFVSVEETDSPQSGSFDSVKDLLTLLRTRDGIIDVISEEQALFCPYTGKPLRIVPGLIEGTFCVTGGWDPCVPVETAEELAYYAFMRDGVADPKTPKPAVRRSELPRKVTGVVEKVAPDRTAVISDTNVNKEAVGMSEGTVEKLRQTAGVSGAVSMGGLGLPGKFIPPNLRARKPPAAKPKAKIKTKAKAKAKAKPKAKPSPKKPNHGTTSPV